MPRSKPGPSQAFGSAIIGFSETGYLSFELGIMSPEFSFVMLLNLLSLEPPCPIGHNQA